MDHVFFDLFPIVDGVRQTDYPVYSFGLERVARSELIGTFEVEVFSPDNSLYLNAVLEITIVGEKNELAQFNYWKKWFGSRINQGFFE